MLSKFELAADQYQYKRISHSHFLQMLDDVEIRSANNQQSSAAIDKLNFFGGKSSPRLKSNQNNINLDDILNCFICMGRLQNAHMCPVCSKMCCENCIKRWLTEQKSECPHCRAPLRVSKLVNCRFIHDLASVFENIQSHETPKEELCQEHEQRKQYYCKDCQIPICADCAMFGNKHKMHEFEHLSKVYDQHMDQIKREIISLNKRLTDYQSNISTLESIIEQVTKSKQDKQQEINSYFEQLSQKLEDDLKVRLLTYVKQQSDLKEELDLLSNVQNEVTQEMQVLPKSILIQKTEDLIKMLQSINKKQQPNKINSNQVNFEFQSEIIPEYDHSIFILDNYSYKKQNQEIVYSEPLYSNGIQWRLKVYPNGNGVAKNAYLSVFLEMTKGFQESQKYEYRVEMVNQNNPQLCITREFASDFETGECWGYNRFFKIELLEKEGYLIPEYDQIILKFYVRASSYFAIYKDHKRYIQDLEQTKINQQKQIEQQQKQIKDLQQQITEQQEINISTQHSKKNITFKVDQENCKIDDLIDEDDADTEKDSDNDSSHSNNALKENTHTLNINPPISSVTESIKVVENIDNQQENSQNLIGDKISIPSSSSNNNSKSNQTVKTNQDTQNSSVYQEHDDPLDDVIDACLQQHHTEGQESTNTYKSERKDQEEGESSSQPPNSSQDSKSIDQQKVSQGGLKQFLSIDSICEKFDFLNAFQPLEADQFFCQGEDTDDQATTSACELEQNIRKNLLPNFNQEADSQQELSAKKSNQSLQVKNPYEELHKEINEASLIINSKKGELIIDQGTRQSYNFEKDEIIEAKDGEETKQQQIEDSTNGGSQFDLEKKMFTMNALNFSDNLITKLQQIKSMNLKVRKGGRGLQQQQQLIQQPNSLVSTTFNNKNENDDDNEERNNSLQLHNTSNLGN